VPGAHGRIRRPERAQRAARRHVQGDASGGEDEPAERGERPEGEAARHVLQEARRGDQEEDDRDAHPGRRPRVLVDDRAERLARGALAPAEPPGVEDERQPGGGDQRVREGGRRQERPGQRGAML